MRSILLATAIIGFASAAAAQTHVDGYTRRDGTYVAPHMRSSSDHNPNNNWTVQPNINPYTGQAGTRSPSYGLPQQPPPSQGFGFEKRR